MKQTTFHVLIICSCLIRAGFSFSTKFDSKFLEQLNRFCAGKYSHMCTKDLMDFSQMYLMNKKAMSVNPKNKKKFLKESQLWQSIMKNDYNKLSRYFRLR